MKVGVIGNGGREHALCSSLKNSNEIKQIYCFPGNAGTEEIAKNVNLDLDNFEYLKTFIIEEKIGKTLKLKSKIFIERKNKEDLRIKEIKIKSVVRKDDC